MRSVITGGPGTGKSTLLTALAEAGVTVFPEVARAILQTPGGMAMRADRPADFGTAMMEAELDAWDRSSIEPGIHDRGFPDIVGFLRLGGLPVPRKLDQCCRGLRYDGPIFRAPPWREIYAPDAERIQDWDEAVESDAAISAAWRHYGYDLVDLPLEPVPVRLAFVLGLLARAGKGETH